MPSLRRASSAFAAIFEALLVKVSGSRSQSVFTREANAGHWKRFYPDGADADFLAFDNCSPCSAERIKDRCFIVQLKTSEIFSHKVGRKGKNKSVPVMDREVFREDFVCICILNGNFEKPCIGLTHPHEPTPFH